MANKKLIVSIFGLLVMVVGILFVLQIGGMPAAENSSISSSPSSRSTIFDLALQDYNGETVELSKFFGRPLVINSWAAWCPFCRKELIDFAAVQREFGEAVVIIAIDRAETMETAKKYTDELGVTDDLVFLLDRNDSFYKSIGGFSMPETIFVNKSGEIVIHKRGPMDIQEIREKIVQLIPR